MASGFRCLGALVHPWPSSIAPLNNVSACMPQALFNITFKLHSIDVTDEDAVTAR